jgi:arginyl-tRNA synthetase
MSMDVLSPEVELASIVQRELWALLPPGSAPPSVVVERSRPEFGTDYQSGAAMAQAKLLRQPPRAIAEALANRLREGHPAVFSSVTVGGPGFLGMTLAPSFLAERFGRALASPRLGVPLAPRETVVIDFSSPNVAKRMHIGHIRSTIIGDALARIGRFLGLHVITDNHIGDWGTQFGQLIVAWQRWLDERNWASDPVGELERIYVKFHAEAEADPALADLARDELRKLQAGDPANRALWELFRAKSQHAFDDIYGRLDVRFDHTHGESFYNDGLQALVDDLLLSGVAEMSEGAAVIFFRAEDGSDVLPPFLIRKKDGAALYATTDIATIRYRMATWAPARVIYVTDTRQQLHFQQLFAVAKRLSVPCRLDHCWFGVMTLPDGMFSTRKGNVIRLDELLDEAERRARATLGERVAAGGDGFSDEELTHLARVIGIGAVKYADLSRDPRSDIVFSFERMLSLEGNTAPYLQYTGARTTSLRKKAAEQGVEPDLTTLRVETAEERDLLLHAFGLGSAATGAWEQGKPSILATWLYELAGRYHRFYNACPVLRAEDPALVRSRLNLSVLVRRSLEQGLDLLGIQVPDRM